MSTRRSEGEELAYLKTPGAVRDRTHRMLELGRAGRLLHWTVDDSRMPGVVERVAEITLITYPDLTRVPYHSRLRHFGVGGVDRVAPLLAHLSGASAEERLRALFELVITSVLLDAGAGPAWSFEEPSGERYARSEGLAVASIHLFESGALSSDPSRPLQADAAGLAAVTEDVLARAFQVRSDNPLVGLSGRAALLRGLATAVSSAPGYFGEGGTRLGELGVTLARLGTDGTLPAARVLRAVLEALGSIWPGRETLAGENLGDVWVHSLVGHVPFHKLSQWLTYSLCEVLELSGLRIVDLDALTGLAEYRNGGLFVDAGVLLPRDPDALSRVHEVSSELVIEWRALTVALLDETATRLRSRLGSSAEALPLAKVLEGGTWRAGRAIAAEKRADGGPPLSIRSDGTVF